MNKSLKKDMRITILVENTVYKSGLKTENGLSFWIEYGDNKILFDTGQSDLVLHNARILGIDLTKTDIIILSHGHYDHTGGLPSVLNVASKAKVYLHPVATEPKFSQKTSEVKYIGMSDSAKKGIEDCLRTWTVTPVVIFPGMSVTGQVPRMNDYEDAGGAFFVDDNCHRPDELLDDQSLFFESPKGLIVVFGCGHAGVINTLDYISKLTGEKNMYAVIGGMHLLNANPTRIENTIKAFKKYKIQKIMPLHCTGKKAIDAIKNAFGEKCLTLKSGGQINF